jgi:hypothetical protein
VLGRVRTDAAAALTGAGRRSQDWLRAGDNALMIATAVIAIVLLITVAAL